MWSETKAPDSSESKETGAVLHLERVRRGAAQGGEGGGRVHVVGSGTEDLGTRTRRRGKREKKMEQEIIEARLTPQITPQSVILGETRLREKGSGRRGARATGHWHQSKADN